MTIAINHLTKLLERLQHAETQYKTANGSLDISPLEVIIAKTDLKSARYAFDAACREYVLENVLNVKEEVL